MDKEWANGLSPLTEEEMRVQEIDEKERARFASLSYSGARQEAYRLLLKATVLLSRFSDGSEIPPSLYLIELLKNNIDVELFWRDPIGEKTYLYGKKPIPANLRKLVFERDEYRCVECGSWKDLECDHVVPESKGGPTIEGNLQTLCGSCNARKGGKIWWNR